MATYDHRAAIADRPLQKLNFVAMYRRNELDHDRYGQSECKRGYCSHMKKHHLMERIVEEGYDAAYAAKGSPQQRGVFLKGMAAYAEGVSLFDDPYSNKQVHHRSGYRRRGGWRVSGFGEMYAWHWKLGWAWAAYLDSNEGALLAIGGTKLDLFGLYLEWLYPKREA